MCPVPRWVRCAAALQARLDAAIPAPPGTPAPGSPAAAAALLRTGVADIISAIVQLDPQNTDQAVFSLSADTFATWFGDAVDGKTYRGVTAAPEGSAFVATTTTSDAGAGQQFAAALGGFTGVAATRLAPAPLAPLAGPDALAGGIGDSLRPRTALPARLGTVLGGVGDLTAELARSRRLKPVLAYPRFDDPLFEPLRQLSQDAIVPNIADLPPETIAVMEPNPRFIESLLAGASTEMARELLWNEYPTDQRGTYFPRFWDARDAGVPDPPPDIKDLNDWTGALGDQSGRSGGLLVLVVRAELLVMFPNTIVFAQQARFVGSGAVRARTLDDTGAVAYPVLRGNLDPDIALYGFELGAAEAAGSTAAGSTDAGWFFCFMERPGQVRFGLDTAPPGPPAAVDPPLLTWDDLAWSHLQPADADEVLVTANDALAPSSPGLPTWGATSAHLASILCQNPVLLARHATDMLPPPAVPPTGPTG